MQGAIISMVLGVILVLGGTFLTKYSLMYDNNVFIVILGFVVSFIGILFIFNPVIK